MRVAKSLLAVLVIACALVFAAAAAVRYHGYCLAQQWQAQIESASDQELVKMLNQAAASGRPGIPLVLEALSSPRATVSWTAKTVLMEQIDRWHSSSAAIDRSCLTELADQLAAGVDRWSGMGRGHAGQLATRLLQLPAGDDAAMRQRLIASCEYVLSAGDATQPAPPDGLTANALAGLFRNDAAEPALPEGCQSPLPGGEPPTEGSSSPQSLSRPAQPDIIERSAAGARPSAEPPRGC